MSAHPLLPGVRLNAGFIHPSYEQYLRTWRQQAIDEADDGIVAASVCHQATMIDLVLDGRLTHDWISIMEDCLTDDAGLPLAYSTKFGKLLYNFENQYLQSTIHAIYTRWWIERQAKPQTVDHGRYAELMLAKKGTDGLIIDSDISPTTLRHRMKAEISMSAVMAAEVLAAADQLSDRLRIELATSLADPKKVPPLGYMTSEQFRLAALRILGHEEQFPTGIEEHIKACEEGLDRGWGDFSIASKVDAYMGTAKRTSRDKQIHSPLVACHVNVLAGKVCDVHLHDAIMSRLSSYAAILKLDPLDIPAFQMRDVPIAFGVDMTPIEAICASHLIANF